MCFLVANEFNHHGHLGGKVTPCMSKTAGLKSHGDAYVIAGSMSRKDRQELAGLRLQGEGPAVEFRSRKEGCHF